MNKDIRINDESVRWIEPVLEKWIGINRDYIDQYNNDCLYWYNERANISAFAGAVWRLGGFALEEYPTTKGSPDSRAHGRVDLFFSIDKDKAIVEAKMAWIKLAKRTRLTLKEKIDRVKSKADKDIIKSLQANDYDLGFGFSFIAPYWDIGYDNATESMKSLRQEMDDYPCAFYAIFENTQGNDIVSSKKNVCNVCVLVGTTHGQE